MWLLNKYHCERCGRSWTDEWSCACDDDCPRCGERHVSPFDSDDLSAMVVKTEAGFAVLRSPDTAEDDPGYAAVAVFATRSEAEAFLTA
jgi:hypothetical protein